MASKFDRVHVSFVVSSVIGFPILPMASFKPTKIQVYPKLGEKVTQDTLYWKNYKVNIFCLFEQQCYSFSFVLQLSLCLCCISHRLHSRSKNLEQLRT